MGNNISQFIAKHNEGSNPQVNKQTAVLLEWIKKLAAAFRVELTEETLAVYVEQLLPYKQESLEFAFRQCIHEWDKPSLMPPIAFLLERATRISMQAEQQWQLVLEIFHHHWHPDIGLYSDPPKLDGAGEYALRQIGGWNGFSASLLEHEGFIRDRFIEAYRRYHAEGGEQAHFTQE